MAAPPVADRNVFPVYRNEISCVSLKILCISPNDAGARGVSPARIRARQIPRVFPGARAGGYGSRAQSTAASAPRTVSNQAATRSRVSSVPIGPAICSPTERPSGWKPALMLSAGCPDML